MQHILERLQSQAEARFRAEGASIGLKNDEMEEFIRKIRLPEHHGGERLALELFSVVMMKQLIKNMDGFSGMIRSFQGLANHCTHQSADRPASELCYILEDILREEGRSFPKDTPAFLELIADAHDDIDTFFKTYAEKTADAPDNLSVRSITNMRSVSHHILDWMIQTNAHAVCKKPSSKLAAMAIGTMININARIDNFLSLPLKDLAQFGGWSGSGSMQSSVIRSAFRVLNGVHDPTLLVPNPEELEEGWEDRIADFAGMNEEEEGATGSPEDFLFDDCPICEAQKRAIVEGRPITENELRSAFRHANVKDDDISF